MTLHYAFRNAVAVGLAVAVLATSTTPVLAQTRPYRATVPYNAPTPSRPEQSSPSLGEIFTFVFGAVALGCLLTNCFGGSDTASEPSTRGGGGYYPTTRERQRQEEHPIDLGVGCFWGYKSMGTCH